MSKQTRVGEFTHIFVFNTPAEINDSSVGNVYVAGTFNNWGRDLQLKKVDRRKWELRVEIPVAYGEKYHLYKFYVQQKWTGVPTAEDKWMLDYGHPVLLQGEGKDCNFLEFPVNQFEKQGSFTFRWSGSVKSKVEVLLDIEKDWEKRRREPLIQNSKGEWEATIALSLPLRAALRPTDYWYIVDENKRWNPDERRGKAFDGYCNVISPEDLKPFEEGTLKTDDRQQIHKFFITYGGSFSQVFLRTSLDDFKTQHKLLQEHRNKWVIKVRLSCPLNEPFAYCFVADGAHKFHLAKPTIEIQGMTVNVSKTGQTFNTMAESEVAASAPEMGRYRFCWASPHPAEVYVAGTFNNWRREERCKLKLSADGAFQEVFVDIPRERTKYKFNSDTFGWAVNPFDRVESPGFLCQVNYLVPEDIGIIPSSENASLSMVSSPAQGFRLSERAAGARGM